MDKLYKKKIEIMNVKTIYIKFYTVYTFFKKIHLIQGLRATQVRGLLSEIVVKEGKEEVKSVYYEDM